MQGGVHKVGVVDSVHRGAGLSEGIVRECNTLVQLFGGSFLSSPPRQYVLSDTAQ